MEMLPCTVTRAFSTKKPALLPESSCAALFGRIAKQSRALLQNWHRDEDRYCTEDTCRLPKPVLSPVYGSHQDSWRAAVRALFAFSRGPREKIQPTSHLIQVENWCMFLISFSLKVYSAVPFRAGKNGRVSRPLGFPRLHRDLCYTGGFCKARVHLGKSTADS